MEVEVGKENGRRNFGRRFEHRTGQSDGGHVRTLFYYDAGRSIRKNQMISDRLL